MFIKVKVFPNSKKEEIIERAEDSFEIKVKEKPINNQANLAVFEVLADYFSVPLNKIRLIKGAKSRNKIFEVKYKQRGRYGNQKNFKNFQKT